MVVPRHIQLVGSHCGPLEASSQLDHGDRQNDLVDLNGTEHVALSELLQQEFHNLANRRHGAAEVEARSPIKRIAPGRRYERNEQTTGRYHDTAEPRVVVGVHNLDGQTQGRDISPVDAEDSGIRLEAYAPRTRNAAQQPIQCVAGAGKRIDNQRRRRTQACGGNRGDVFGNRVPQFIARAFDSRPSEESGTLRMPIRRSHSVDGDIVRIAIAVAAIALDLQQLQNRIALRAEQEQFTVM